MFNKNLNNFSNYYSAFPIAANKPVPSSNFVNHKSWFPPIVYRDQLQNASNIPLRNIYRCQKIKTPQIVSFNSVSSDILLDPSKAALLIVCYFKDPENYTMTSFGPVLDPSLPVNEFRNLVNTSWIYFKDYLHSKLYTIIINGYNYSGRTISDQISKEAFIKKFIDYMSDKTYVIGHGACLESIFYNIHLYLQKHKDTTHNLDNILFVEAPKVGPIYIWPGCFKEMNHNNNCCSNCVYMNMCKAISMQIKESSSLIAKKPRLPIQLTSKPVIEKNDANENDDGETDDEITNNKIIDSKEDSIAEGRILNGIFLDISSGNIQPT